eukprot:3589243-Prymnesium_polylepis.1
MDGRDRSRSGLRHLRHAEWRAREGERPAARGRRWSRERRVRRVAHTRRECIGSLSDLYLLKGSKTRALI